ncbi:uncharacterized protein BJ171DRAFT_102702 [Polychytrium aggregatum]|uniref:uncharacterized protein n=1 Tax=Polychytrium aggregatum TaxID=110093 RepID=UPI0022FEEE28|nr:uncharacterized protein BJ171DRAFT_102702 [Polychytrium aggregatum]KAI9190533.1 hypothetical protein BJ171DRAFT_102702 [Polychytrium aggregatum]
MADSTLINAFLSPQNRDYVYTEIRRCVAVVTGFDIGSSFQEFVHCEIAGYLAHHGIPQSKMDIIRYDESLIRKLSEVIASTGTSEVGTLRSRIPEPEPEHVAVPEHVPVHVPVPEPVLAPAPEPTIPVIMSENGVFEVSALNNIFPIVDETGRRYDIIIPTGQYTHETVTTALIKAFEEQASEFSIHPTTDPRGFAIENKTVTFKCLVEGQLASFLRTFCGLEKNSKRAQSCEFVWPTTS